MIFVVLLCYLSGNEKLDYVTKYIGRFFNGHGTVAVTNNLFSIIGYIIKFFDYANVVLFSLSGMFTQLCAI